MALRWRLEKGVTYNVKKKAQNIRSTGFPEAVIQQLALSRSGV